MAVDIKEETSEFLTGSKLEVTVETAVNDSLLVSFNNGCQYYRGVLLNTSPGSWPYGASVDDKLSSEGCSLARPHDPLSFPEVKVNTELSALFQRHTYYQKMSSAETKAIQSAKKDIASVLWQKGRKSLLRSQRSTCSLCGRGTSEPRSSASDSAGISANPNKSLIPHFTPAIRISYASPMGEDTVVKIGPKPDCSLDTDKLISQWTEGASLDHKKYKKLKRALRKAWLRSKHLMREPAGKRKGCQLVPSHSRSPPKEAAKDEAEEPPALRRLRSSSSKSEEDATRTEEVEEVMLEDGRTLQCGCVCWAKIPGCAWWPCRIRTLSHVTDASTGAITASTAEVAWFGSSTFSVVECSELTPFLEEFHKRYNRKKKKGNYRGAVKAALTHAKLMTQNQEYLSLEL